MSVRIYNNGEVRLTQQQYEWMHREWLASQSMTTMPQSFESWVVAHQREAQDVVKKMAPIFERWKS